MDSISSDLKLAELKKDNIRKAFEHIHAQSSSLLLLTLQWKDLEDHYNSTQKSIQQRLEELESKAKQLDPIQKLIEERSREAESTQKLIEDCLKELEYKEKQFDISAKERVEEVELKEKQFGERCQELELKEKLFGERFVEHELKEKRFGECVLELEVKEKELDAIRESVGECLKELELKQKRFEERSEEFELKEKELGSIQKSIDERFKEVELKEKLFEERSEELKSKEKQFKELVKEVESKVKQFEERRKGLELKEKQFEERSKELELKAKQFEERTKGLEMKEKRFVDIIQSRVKIEQPENFPVNNAIDPPSANLQFCVSMDGKSLQLFLNEHVNEHDSMRVDVINALRLSSDPAKLVLDAMQGFYPPYLKKEGVEFEESVIRRSCILLLEQLMRVSPRIKPHVREEAMELAVDWKAKMRVEKESSLEVLGFLQVLATYGLTCGFDADELLSLFEAVTQHEQAIELFRVLGFTDKVPDFIQILIKKKQYLEAIRLIYAFELVDKFPPVPLLKNYLKYSKKIARTIWKTGNETLEAQIDATNTRVAALRTVIKLIEDRKLESEFSPELLEKCIPLLKKQNANSEPTAPAPAPAPNAQPQQQSEKTCIAPAPAPAPALVMAPATCPTTALTLALKNQPKKRSRNKRRRIVVSGAAAPNTSVGAVSTLHLIRPTLRLSAYPSTSPRQYSLGSFTPVNPHMSSYPNSSTPRYPMDALRKRIPGYYDGPVSFGGLPEAIREPGHPDRPVSFGGSTEALREPGYPDRPVSFGGYSLPPPFRPPFYP